MPASHGDRPRGSQPLLHLISGLQPPGLGGMKVCIQAPDHDAGHKSPAEEHPPMSRAERAPWGEGGWRRAASCPVRRCPAGTAPGEGSHPTAWAPSERAWALRHTCCSAPIPPLGGACPSVCSCCPATHTQTRTHTDKQRQTHRHRHIHTETHTK